MNIDSLREYCLGKKGTAEDFPFDETVLAIRVAGKMFVLANLENTPLTINLKCDPEKALELRDRYEAVTPGYHMNKRHWNTVVLNGTVPDREVREWIDHSYELVAAGLPRSERQRLLGE